MWLLQIDIDIATICDGALLELPIEIEIRLGDANFRARARLEILKLHVARLLGGLSMRLIRACDVCVEPCVRLLPEGSLGGERRSGGITLGALGAV